MNWTVWFAACTANDCTQWNSHVTRAKHAHESFRSFPRLRGGRSKIFDTREPVWNCRSKERVPAQPGDGPKFICGIHTYSFYPVHVFSLGSNGDTKFEEAIHRRIPHATITTVDPTLTPQRRMLVSSKPFIHLKENAIGDGSVITINGQKYSSKRLTDIVRTNESIVLKMDIEGFEAQTMQHIKCEEITLDQFLVEVHGKSSIVFDWADECNLLMFSKEVNIWGGGGKCSEFSFLSAPFAYKEYMLS